MKRVLIFSAPSGSGKSTIIHRLLSEFPKLRFSVSATSRPRRGVEVDGVDYHFLSEEEFARRAQAGEFLEWEEVYTGTCYGTLRSEIERIWNSGDVAVFDVDVVGGVNLRRIFGDHEAVSVYIVPPSIDVLRERLVGRGTDSEQAIERRLSKAQQELMYAKEFDYQVINDQLEVAISQVRDIISSEFEN